MKKISVKVFFTDREDRKIIISKEEIEELLNEAYKKGYEDGEKERNYIIPTTPVTTPMPSYIEAPIITC